MFVDLSPIESFTFLLDLEERHPVVALFSWFPWLQRLPSVRTLFRIMLLTFGERFRLAPVGAHLEAAEALDADSIRHLLARFRTECPTDMIEIDLQHGTRWNYNLSNLYARAIEDVCRGHARPDELIDARRQTVLVFCQLLLALGLSPTAP